MHCQNKKYNIMYKANFLILNEANNEIVRSFSDTNLTNVLVYVGDLSWSLKLSRTPFCVNVQRITTDTSVIVFSFSSIDL